MRVATIHYIENIGFVSKSKLELTGLIAPSQKMR